MPESKGDLPDMGRVLYRDQGGGYEPYQGWDEEAPEGEGGEGEDGVNDSEPSSYAAAAATAATSPTTAYSATITNVPCKQHDAINGHQNHTSCPSCDYQRYHTSICSQHKPFRKLRRGPG